MKKLLLLTLICIISLSLIACSDKGAQHTGNTDTSANTDASTNVDTDTDVSTSTNEVEPLGYTKIDGAIQPEYSVKYESREYYTTLEFATENYIATDLPNEYGNFYKVVKSYDKFLSLVEHGNFIEESVFEEYNLLLIYRNYGGRYSTDIGFNNFEYRGGCAYIDLYEYTGELLYDDCEFSVITYLLISKETHCYEKEFEPINISVTTEYSYNYDYVDIENIELGNRAIIFTDEDGYDAFEYEYGIEAFYSGACIIIPNVEDWIISCGPLTLEGNKLTLAIDTIQYPSYQDEGYVIVRIPTSPYAYDAPYFDEEIPQDVELEIIIMKNNQPIYSKEHTKEEWENAIDATINAENYTKSHSISFLNSLNDISNARGTFKHIKNTFGELAYFYNYQNGQRTVHALYQDFANDRRFEVENAKWVSKEGTSLHDCLIPFVSLNEIKDSFDSATYSFGIYSIEQVGDYHNIILRIANGRLVYLSYYVDYVPERDRYNEHHVIYFYDYGSTEIELPTHGEGAPLSYLAEKRASKVTIDLDMRSIMGEVMDEKAGYIGINANGNEYIAYAPNIYTYYVQIQANRLNYNIKEVTQLVSGIENDYFDDVGETKKIDAIWHNDDYLMLYFPDFDSYFECQEDLLDGLSKLDMVYAIKVGYIDTQNEHTIANEYDVIIAYGNSECFDNDCLFSSYAELEAELGAKLTTNEALKAITSETFEIYYVFGINTFDYRNTVGDARIVNNTVYFTVNRYYEHNKLEDAIDRSCSFLVLVPKSELEELPENITVKTVRTTILDGEEKAN